MYIFILGPPGSGKSKTAGVARELLDTLVDDQAPIHGFRFASTNVTRASLTDEMIAAERKFVSLYPEKINLHYHSMMLMVTELAAFMPKPDVDLLGIMTKFYDRDEFSEAKRGGEKGALRHKIKHPQLNLLVCAVPSTLMSAIPVQGWEEGLISRSILIFSNLCEKPKLYEDVSPLDLEDLKHDLRCIFTMHGNVAPTKEAIKALDDWGEYEGIQGEKGYVPPPKLKTYKARRREHLVKLCVIACVSRTDDMIMTKQDFNTALGWLIEAEKFMPEIFNHGSKPLDMQAIDEALFFIQENDRGAGVGRTLILRHLAKKVNTNTLFNIFKVMEASGYIIEMPKKSARDPETYYAVPEQFVE